MRDQSKTPQLPQCTDRCKKYCTSVSKSPSNFTLKICLLSHVGECKEGEGERALEAAKVLCGTGTVIRWQHAGVWHWCKVNISIVQRWLLSFLYLSSVLSYFVSGWFPFVLISTKNKHSFLSCSLSLSQTGYYSLASSHSFSSPMWIAHQ